MNYMICCLLQGLPLPDVVLFQICLHLIEHLSFIARPQRSDQKRLGTVACEPVYDDIGAKGTQAAADDKKLLHQISDRKIINNVIHGKVCLF